MITLEEGCENDRSERRKREEKKKKLFLNEKRGEESTKVKCIYVLYSIKKGILDAAAFFLMMYAVFLKASKSINVSKIGWKKINKCK